MNRVPAGIFPDPHLGVKPPADLKHPQWVPVWPAPQVDSRGK
jgi:hypothetical protein